MIVAVHQPHFLPWLGYLNKVLNADVFIWLDTVQYRKNYFQNRTRIMSADGREQWLTLPVHAGSTARIDDVTIADARWRDRIAKSVRQCYAKSAHFGEVWPVFEEAMGGASDRLTDVDYALFIAALRLLGAGNRTIVRASELGETSTDPTERLVTLCERVGGARYIAGRGGRSYMSVDAFERAGIKVIWQEFDVDQTAYTRSEGRRVSGYSVLDVLCHVGGTETHRLACHGWNPHPGLTE